LRTGHSACVTRSEGDVDRRAAEVDETIEAVVLAADGLRVAAAATEDVQRSAADTRLSILVAQQAQATEGANKRLNEARAVILHHVAALDGTSGALIAVNIGIGVGRGGRSAAGGGGAATRSIGTTARVIGTAAARGLLGMRVVTAWGAVGGWAVGWRPGDSGDERGNGDEDGLGMHF